MRATALGAQALAAGSPLACLDAIAGETVKAACEKALFATPAAVAAATSYTAARLSLLADAAAYSQRYGVGIDGVSSPLRRALEADRFGFVAHTLAVRDGCSGGNCKALALLRDPSHVHTNLIAATLDRYLDHYATLWAQGAEGPMADATSAQTGAAGTAGKKVVVDIDFPTAASIPPVSIMAAEPKGPVTPASAAAAVAAGAADSSAQTAAQAAAKQVRKPAKPPAQSAQQAAPPAAPMSVAPPAPVEPVWSPGATLASPQPEGARPQ
jgi:hypothetical protein